MRKILRSLILEKFPLDLRVKLDLLSRRRDITNEEKHDELLNILKNSDVKIDRQLGPGTNRYAVNIDGFVVKFATDHDGKIDNMKEFKMAKRLFPYVAKTYDVSQNGVLLVAEYIPPFISFTEMLQYADQIREILRKISAVYLIGDAGISDKNFGNWGLRPGTNEPVCLDFAYVYEVSSRLFVCPECKVGAMLVPDNDFKDLYCSNKACGKKKLFEDIRAKIGNDIHNHEIGDLSDEGYKLTESFTETELTLERSNYLVKKFKKEKEEYDENINHITDEESEQESIIIKEEEIMDNKFITNVTVTAVNAAKKNPNLFKLKDRPNPKVVAQVKTENESLDSADNEAEEIQEELAEEVIEEIKESEAKVAFSGTFNDFVSNVQVKVSTPDDEEVKKPVEANKGNASEWIPIEDRFYDSFVHNAHKAVSLLANRITFDLKNIQIFDKVKTTMKRNMYPETFYNNIQNCVFLSLVDYLNFIETEVPKKDSNEKAIIFIPPIEAGSDNFDHNTMMFIQRIYLDKELSNEKNPEKIMDLADDLYGDAATFINSEWLFVLEDKLKRKMKLTVAGAKIVTDRIDEIWCDSFIDENTSINLSEEDEPIVEEEPVTINPENTYEDIYGNQDEEGEEYVNADEVVNEDEMTTIDIYPEDDVDIVKLYSVDAFGETNIPIYIRLAEIDIEESKQYNSFEENGCWDWLIHTVPDIMFRTKNPQKWLEINNEEYEEGDVQIHTAIMQKYRTLSSGEDEYVMGLFNLKGIYLVDDDYNREFIFDPTLLEQLNAAINTALSGTIISHLHRSLRMTQLIYDESYIKMMLNNNESNTDDIDSDIGEESSINNEIEENLQSNTNEETSDELVAKEESETVVTEESVEEPKEETPQTTSSAMKPVRRKRS